MTKFLNFLKSFFPKKLTLWYVGWFLLTSYYLWHHWDEAITFSPFNGNSLIFCVWIGMILKPFVGEIETPWIKARMNAAEVEQKESKENFEAVKKAEEKKKETEQNQEKEAK